jgi:hypothetical protein
VGKNKRKAEQVLGSQMMAHTPTGNKPRWLQASKPLNAIYYENEVESRVFD